MQRQLRNNAGHACTRRDGDRKWRDCALNVNHDAVAFCCPADRFLVLYESQAGFLSNNCILT